MAGCKYQGGFFSVGCFAGYLNHFFGEDYCETQFKQCPKYKGFERERILEEKNSYFGRLKRNLVACIIRIERARRNNPSNGLEARPFNF